MRQKLVSRICSPFWALGARPSDCVGRRPNWFAQSIILSSLSSSEEEERKGKERKKEEKESSVWKFQDIKVRKTILTLPLFVFFVWFELGLKLAWILFWFGLELSSDKDRKCVKRHVGILGKVLSKFP